MEKDDTCLVGLRRSLASPWLPFSAVVELCAHAEATGWDGVWYADHFMSAGRNATLPLIGGGGEKVTLKITAKYADEWNHWGDAATMAQKGAILDAHCAAIGRDPGEIQRSAAVLLFMAGRKSDVAAQWAAHPASKAPPGTPGRSIVGTPAECATSSPVSRRSALTRSSSRTL